MEKFIEKAISDFEQEKLSDKKQSRPYGEWNEKWNINKTLNKAINYYLINKIIKNEY